MKQRTSYYDPNRTCYMDKDGNYIYEVLELQDDGTYKKSKIVIENKGAMVDIIKFLDEDDHNQDLQQRHQDEMEDPYFRKLRAGGVNDDEEEIIPIEMVADPSKGDIIDEINAEENHLELEKHYDESDKRYKKFTKSLNDEDLYLIKRHAFDKVSIPKVAEELGKTDDALESRWRKIKRHVEKDLLNKK